MSDKFLFARLNNQNYQVWKMRMQSFLKREDTWSAIDEPKPEPVTVEWTKADRKAHAAIILYVEDNQLNLVRDAVSAQEAWTKIKEFHEKTTMTSRVSVLRRICSLNMPEGGDVEKHLVELEELFDRLSCAGLALEVPLRVAMIYRSLPESFGGLVTAMESRADGDQTIELVKQKLLDEYQRRSERSAASSADVSERALKVQSGGRNEKICYYCRKPGHFRRDCRQLKQSQQQERNDEPPWGGKRVESKAKQASEADVAICFTAGSERSYSGWLVDSGCSNHMTNQRAFFTKLDENVNIKVVLADGSTTTSSGMGEGVVKCVDGQGRVLKIPFQDVLYVPTLDSALLSVRKLAQKGMKVDFGDSRCAISTSAGKVVAVAELRDNLYWLKEAKDPKLDKEIRQLPNRQRNPAVHERIQEEDCGLRQVDKPCPGGKSSRISFPKPSQNRSERVLDLVHIHVYGPMKNITPGGCRYLMTLVDDRSRYTVVCLLRQKSDAVSCTKRFVAHVKARFGRSPCVIRSDSGSGHVCQELKQFYSLEGIEAQFASQSNGGVAERQSKLLQETATRMLVDADLPERFWGEAVATAAYQQNRLPLSTIQRTPYEVWFGQKPSVCDLRTFGSRAYVHKLDGKAQQLLFVGYCGDQKAYRFLDPKTNEITISSNAQFIELGDGSSMSCDPMVTGGEHYVALKPEEEEVAIQEEPIIEYPQEPELDEPQIKEEEHSNNESDDEFYGFDEADNNEPDTGLRQDRSIPLMERSQRFIVDYFFPTERDNRNVIQTEADLQE